MKNKIALILVIFMAGITTVSAKSYKVVTELPRTIYIQNVGTRMYMEAKGGDVKLYNGRKSNQAQMWRAIRKGSDGDFVLRNRSASKYLRVKTKKSGRLIKRKKSYVGVDKKYTKVKFLMLSSNTFLMKLSSSKVADAKGGTSKKKNGQAVIPYKLNNGSNQKWKIWYVDGSRKRLFDYNRYMASKRRKEKEEKDNRIGENKLKNAISMKDYYYMKKVSLAQFLSDNRKTPLAKGINEKKDVDRFIHTGDVVKNIKYNRDSRLRTAVYKELLKVDLSGDGFAITLAKSGIKSTVSKAYRKERIRAPKSALQELLKKLK